MSIRMLVDRLREIHYYQIFEPAIKIGVLSGYILARNEKPCSYYPHSQYRKKPRQVNCGSPFTILNANDFVKKSHDPWNEILQQKQDINKLLEDVSES